MDLIDRQAAIISLTFAEETGRMSCGELKGVIEVLNRLPSAQPKRKKGKWIFIESIYKRDGWNADIYRCDQCNRKIQMRVVLKKGEDITDYKRYCESCGALMEGVDDKRVSD